MCARSLYRLVQRVVSGQADQWAVGETGGRGVVLAKVLKKPVTEVWVGNAYVHHAKVELTARWHSHAKAAPAHMETDTRAGHATERQNATGNSGGISDHSINLV